MADTKKAPKNKDTYAIADELGIMAMGPTQLIRHALHCANTNTPLLVLGRPGVGKTEILGEVAASLRKSLIVERLNGRDPTDMGLPYIYEDKGGFRRHGWSLPDWFRTEGEPTDEDNPGGWMYFFDELAQAYPAMQNRIGEILNERQLNRAKMNDKVWIALAANFAQDKAATYPIPKQIMNRVSAVILAPDNEDLFQYMSQHDIRPELMAFVKLFPDCTDSYDPDAMINCTPRSICSLSKLMDERPAIEDEMPLYASRIGKGWASQLVSFLKTYRNLPSLDAIIKDPKKTKVPDDDSTDVLCALGAMLGRALSPKNATPVVEYLMRLPSEFCVFALRDAVRRDAELKKCRALTQWAISHGDVLL